MSGGELVGDPKLKITGAASLAEATSGEISFFGNRKYIGLLRKTRASAVFVPPDFAEPLAPAQVRVSNPTKAFEQVVLKVTHEAVGVIGLSCNNRDGNDPLIPQVLEEPP